MLRHRVVHTAVAAVCWSTDSRCSTNAAGVFPDLVYRSPSLLLSPVYISERGRGEKYEKKKKKPSFFSLLLFFSLVCLPVNWGGGGGGVFVLYVL